MIAKKTIAMYAIALMVFIAGCKKDDFIEIDGVCPVVVSTIPANGATGVPLNQIISVTFNEEMNPSTINQASFTINGSTPVPGTITVQGTTATFTPTNPLSPNTTYTGRITTSVKDKTGNALQVDYVWTFSTGALLSPLVITTDPENLEANVNLNKVIMATFNMPMNALTINGSTFTLSQNGNAISGTVTYTGTTASFIPTVDLATNTTFTATITTGAKNPAGQSLSSNYVWIFTTGSLRVPMVISTDPTNNEVDVVLNKIVTATFSEEMNASSITTSTFTLRQGATLISGQVSYSGVTASFIPDEPLLPGTIYTGTILKSVKNLLGVLMTNDYTWTFTTDSGAEPLVISTDPADNETNVALNKTISATFSEVMNPSTLNNATFTLKQGATILSGVVSYSGSTAYFNPITDLVAGTTYTATITTGAKSLTGASLANNYTWTFTTGALVAPTVISTDPENNATSVSLSKTVAATFSVPMDPSTLNSSTFTLHNGVTNVPGTVTYSGTTASFNPTSNLVAGITYTATITTGAKNLAGTSLSENYVWIFSTGSLIAPTVISTDPENNATGVSIGKTITATFSVPMDPTTLNASTFTLKNGINTVTGTINYFGSTVSFNPTSDLLPGTTYTATITTGAKNVAGTPMVANYVWTFTTAAAVVPTVISTDPANNATNVELNKIITATFSVPMDPTTLNASTFTLKNGVNTVTGSITYSGTVVSFNPTSDLLPGTLYTATITTGAKSAGGTPMAANYVWTFTTAVAAVVPTVTSTDPANNETNVALNKTITATFSIPMDPTTLNASTFTLKNGVNTVTGSITYAGTVVSFNPTSDLLPGTLYTATITTGAESVTGTPMAANYVWTFTTAAAVIVPTVTSTDPANNATNLALNKTITATFSISMDPTTLNASTFTLKNGVNTVTGSITSAGTVVTFNPTSDLLPGTLYTATITTGAKSVAGTPMAAPYLWTFTTAAAVVPTVTSTDPANNATNVALNKTITATFSIPMDPTTLNASTFTLKNGVNTVTGSITYAGTVVTFNPTSDLLPGTLYTATITTGAKSVAGTPLAANYVWTFTTEAAVVPTVTSTDPANNATNVAINKTITASFSIPMDPTTINASTFTLKNGAITVTGTITYLGLTASFNPTSDLLENTEYTATITTGAKSVAGTSISSDYIWTFRTLAPSGGPFVDLGSVARFGIIAGVGVSNNAGFSEIRNMDVGITPGVRSSITGFPPAIVVNGAIFASDDIAPPGVAAMLTEAKDDLTAAYLFAEGATTPAPATVSGDLGGLTLAPGIYKTTSTLLIQSGDLTLDAQGNPNAVWIFQVASGFTTIGGAGGNVILSGGAQASNVFWQVGSSATIGDFTNFYGNILALTSITMNSGATATGRMLCINGAVVMTNTNFINKP